MSASGDGVRRSCAWNRGAVTKQGSAGAVKTVELVLKDDENSRWAERCSPGDLKGLSD